jgi:hypothetical protein
MWNGIKLMACLELERIDPTIERSLHFAKILLNNTTTLPPQFFQPGLVLEVRPAE